MTDLLHFSPTSSSEHAMLGAIHVGTVQLMDSTDPKGRAQWIGFLPDEAGRAALANWKIVRSADHARTALRNHVTVWVKNAGLMKRPDQGASS